MVAGETQGTGPAQDAVYASVPLRDEAVPQTPPLGGPETPRLGTFESPAQDSPKATDPLFVRSYSPGPGLGVRDSLQPSPSFMSAGASRHDSYQSYDSGMPFAGDKRASQASGLTAESRSTGAALGPSPLAAGAVTAAGAGAAGAGAGAAAGAGPDGLGWRTSPLADEELDEKKPKWMQSTSGMSSKKKKWLIIAAVWIVLLVGLGVGLGVGLSQRFKKDSADENSKAGQVEVINGSTTTHASATKSPQPTASSTPEKPLVTGGFNGSKVLLSNGNEVDYINPHGGYWAYDPTNPMLNAARPNSWTPPLNESWNWDQVIDGVNVGGWFVTEPFIVPGLYEAFPEGPAGKSRDEFTLSVNMGDKLEEAMEEHYKTFVTEEDFMLMAASGLNWVRIPIGFWAIETWEDEPFLEKVAWKYILQALSWCRKYGLRVNLDLHAIPGSQNGWNHSGRIGTTNWMNGVMGLANLQRSMDYLEALVEFSLQPEWRDIICIFGMINEPQAGVIGRENVGSYYMHWHDKIRSITGVGEGKGPVISFFEGFVGVDKWYGFAQGNGGGMDRAMLDVHQYTVFQMPQDTNDVMGLSTKGCTWWAETTNKTQNSFGLQNTGEWSLAWNDCGQWVNGVDLGARYDGTHADANGVRVGDCEQWMRPENFNATVRAAIKDTWMAGVDALQSNFFWTWNIGSTKDYENPAPFWSYKLGLKEGWITNNPRDAAGHCARVVGVEERTPFTGYQPFMTGGSGAGQVPATASAQYPWPITSMAPSFNAQQLLQLPQYTRTGAPLKVPSVTSSASSVQSSIASQMQPTEIPRLSGFAEVSGCTYPDRYNAADMAAPASGCGAGASLSGDNLLRRAVITQAPTL